MNKYKATIGICGNVLIIVLMAKKRLNSAVDILVINLAAADCLYCLGLPIWAYEMMHKFTYNIPSGPKISKFSGSGPGHYSGHCGHRCW